MRFVLSAPLSLLLLVCASWSSAQPPQPKPDHPPTKLYTDEEIRKLAKHDIDKVTGTGEDLLGTPILEVVPPGESYPRAKVFKALNLDDGRIQDFRHSAS